MNQSLQFSVGVTTAKPLTTTNVPTTQKGNYCFFICLLDIVNRKSTTKLFLKQCQRVQIQMIERSAIYTTIVLCFTKLPQQLNFLSGHPSCKDKTYNCQTFKKRGLCIQEWVKRICQLTCDLCGRQLESLCWVTFLVSLLQCS